jgi:GNAT superfamily N-acetyltransferase
MTFTISTPAQVPDPEALDDLVFEFYGVGLKKLVAAGGPTHLTPHDLMPSFRSNLSNYQPPNGRTILAHDGEGQLIAACTINQVRPDAGELKRLYVRPSAGGHGLRRKIMDRQFELGRSMGWRSILINVIKGNEQMLSISRKAGFYEIDRYPECADPIELAEFFVYLQYDLE